MVRYLSHPKNLELKSGPGRVRGVPDVKNIFVVYQNTNEVYPAQFLACLVGKRRNETEKSSGGGKVTFPPPATQHCVEDL